MGFAFANDDLHVRAKLFSWTPELLPKTLLVLFPSVSPHFRIPTAFVHLDEVKIGDDSAVILQPVMLNHVRDEAIRLVVAPSALAHETVVDEHLLIGETAAMDQAPVERLVVALAGEHLRLDVFIANRQIAAGASVESLSQHVVIILWEFAVGVQTNLGTHAGKVEQAAGPFVTAFDSFDFHWWCEFAIIVSSVGAKYL